jgi:methionyl-tRNA formyltransferase
MLLDEGMDTGPVLLTRRTPIAPGETAGQLQARLAPMGADLLIETLAGLEDGSVGPTPQDDALATRAPMLRKQDGRLDWSQPAARLERRVRGLAPWPGAFTLLGGRRLKVLEASVGSGPSESEPGTLLRVERGGLLVACGDGAALLLSRVQPESRRPMSGAAFAAGTDLAPGERLD